MTSTSPSPSPSNDHPSKKPKLTHAPSPVSHSVSQPQPVHTPVPSNPQPQTFSTSNDDMEDTEVDLFPDGTVAASSSDNNGPQTPPRNDHLNAIAPGELSPPRSQGNATNGTDPAAAGPNGHPISGQDANTNTIASFNDGAGLQENASNNLANNGKGPAAQGGNGNGNGNWQPGEWRGKKSQEEAVRAWDFVVDQGWRADQFGDVIERGTRARGLA